MKRARFRVQNNIRWLVVGLWAILGIVTLRYAWIQLVQGDEMAARMRQQAIAPGRHH